jgi:hypothetical protein
MEGQLAMSVEAEGRWLKSTIAITIAVVFSVSTGSVASPAEQLIPFTTVAAGTKSGIRTRTLVAIRNRIEWSDLWQKHTAGARGPGAALPAIDFTEQMVIALFAGDVDPETRATVIRVVQKGQRLLVLYQIANLQPGPAPLDPATSTPFHIIRFSRSPLPVIFIPATERDIY